MNLRLIPFLSILLLFGGTALEDVFASEVDRSDPTQVDAEESEAPKGPYSVLIEGVDDPALLDILERSSQLLQLIGTAPASRSGLKRRIDGDVERFGTALRSEGYYGGTVDYSLDTAVEPPAIVIQVSPGEPYLLNTYKTTFVGPHAGELEPFDDPAALGVELEQPARAPRILGAHKIILRRLARIGRPHATIENQDAIVDHAEATMEVELFVDPGPEADFGPLTFSGNRDVKESYLQTLAQWEPGTLYDRRRIEKLRRAINSTGLFDSIKIDPAKEIDEKGEIPIHVTLVEGKHRSIGLGASFSTDEGAGGEIFWEHRNIFGAHETLTLSAEGTQVRQELGADFRKPHFWAFDQSLVSNASLRRNDSEAFKEESINGYVGLERQLDEHWYIAGGVSLELTMLDDNEGDPEEFFLFGLPLSAHRDTTDNPLHPTEGSRLSFATTPYFGTIQKEVVFLVNNVGGSAYYSPFEDDSVILAARARLGSILGGRSETIPASKRFYAGGGGSIRGYEFQTVGPLDDDGDPEGGRSVIELSAEVRYQLTETIGVVPFIAGGNVFDDIYPDPTQNLQWAAGLGLRYFTAIGPIRLDVGFPLNPRDRDDFFQFYVSLGQAF